MFTSLLPRHTSQLSNLPIGHVLKSRPASTKGSHRIGLAPSIGKDCRRNLVLSLRREGDILPSRTKHLRSEVSKGFPSDLEETGSTGTDTPAVYVRRPVRPLAQVLDAIRNAIDAGRPCLVVGNGQRIASGPTPEATSISTTNRTGSSRVVEDATAGLLGNQGSGDGSIFLGQMFPESTEILVPALGIDTALTQLTSSDIAILIQLAIELFVLDVRTNRTNETMISREQMDWLKQGLTDSSSVFKIIMTANAFTKLNSVLTKGTAPFR